MEKPYAKKVIYLDNNGTTRICKRAKTAMIKWLESRANPSADSVIAAPSRALIEHVKKQINAHCGLGGKYRIIFTSGASESNCFILLSVAEAYRRARKVVPHFIISAIEHKSIIDCCTTMADDARAEVSVVQPNAYGEISPQIVRSAIRPNTALISVMYANNELGTIMNVAEIGRVAHESKVPFHTDAVQIFGKKRIKLPAENIDALSASFHKLHGPMGIGLLLINNDLVDGYGLRGQIAGSQQDHLRGGTENVPAIAGAGEALSCAFENRKKKNAHLRDLKAYFIKRLASKIDRGVYSDYFDDNPPLRNEFIVLGPTRASSTLDNTILISFAKNVDNGRGAGKPHKHFCNTRFKKDLNARGIVVSVGSACSTKSKKASHVLTAIKAPQVIKRGIIRVSMCDYNTKKEIDCAIDVILDCLNRQGW